MDAFGFTVCRNTQKYRIHLSEFVKKTVTAVVEKQESTSSISRIKSALCSAVQQFVLFASKNAEQDYPKAQMTTANSSNLKET